MRSKFFPLTVAAAVGFLGALVSGASAQAPGAPGEVTLTGAGATFPSTLYAKWFEAYHEVDPSVRFAYDANGSGAGQREIIDRTVDFGASDQPMSDEALAQAPGRILHLPTMAGAVVVSYNLPGVGALRFDGPTLADIFQGKIVTWNDPEIARQNPGVKLPEMDIVVVHRSDASGTSYIFTDYLSAVSPDWQAHVGKDATLNWPVGLGGRGNEGVVVKLRETPGSIGYLELTYALQNQTAYAEIRNRDHYYTKASLESTTAALTTATIPDDFRFSMVNAPGKDVYPIAGATWLLIYDTQRDPVRGEKLVAFLKWTETEGQKMAAALSFAPLPGNVRDRVLNVIGTLKP